MSTELSMAWSGPPLAFWPCRHPIQVALFIQGARTVAVRVPCAACANRNWWTIVEPTPVDELARWPSDRVAKSAMPSFNLACVPRPNFGEDGALEALATLIGMPAKIWVAPR